MTAGMLIAMTICAFIGFMMGGLCSASSKSEVLAASERRCHEISDKCKELAVKNLKLEEEVEKLRSEIKQKNANIDVLDDIIIRMRTKPEAEKMIKERVPVGMTNMIRYMDYRKLNKASTQYKLQQECETGIAEGIRLYTSGENTYYCAALGSAYGRDLGDTWEVTLKNGTQFKIILAEYKDDGSTDFFGHPDKNYDGESCTNVIEFVVDTDAIPERVSQTGTFTGLEWYGGLNGEGGNIVRMEYLGREWEP